MTHAATISINLVSYWTYIAFLPTMLVVSVVFVVIRPKE